MTSEPLGYHVKRRGSHSLFSCFYNLFSFVNLLHVTSAEFLGVQVDDGREWEVIEVDRGNKGNGK